MESDGRQDRKGGYVGALQTVVAASAFPYGYTLTVWTSGAVLADARGTQTTGNAILYMLGAITAYAGVALGAFRNLRATTPSRPRAFSLWEATHFVSVPAAIGVWRRSSPTCSRPPPPGRSPRFSQPPST